jgi:hypothetical protein
MPLSNRVDNHERQERPAAARAVTEDMLPELEEKEKPSTRNGFHEPLRPAEVISGLWGELRRRLAARSTHRAGGGVGLAPSWTRAYLRAGSAAS